MAPPTPVEHRNVWNEYHHEYYEGPRLTREEAQRRFSDEQGTPESVKYLRHERENSDPDNFTTNATPGTSDHSDCGNNDDADDASSAPHR